MQDGSDDSKDQSGPKNKPNRFIDAFLSGIE